MKMLRSLASCGWAAVNALAVSLVVCAGGESAAADDIAITHSKPPLDLRAMIAARMDVAEFEIQAINIPAGARGTVRIPFTLDQQPAELALRPHSVRATGFAVYTSDGSGRQVRVPTAPPRTYRGSLTGSSDSLVAATITGGTVTALIRHDEEFWVIEPVSQNIQPGEHNLHVVYRQTDVIAGNWTCGTADDPNIPRPNGDIPQSRGGGGVATSCIKVAELAIDADAEYFQLNNSSILDTTMDIETIMNAVNLIYGFQVGIEHLITDLIIHTQIAVDPFTSNAAGGLLTEFGDYRIANPYNNPFDVAHLFTGKEIQGSVIGVAWLGAICDTQRQYGLSQSQFTENFLNRVILTTHELGHNWNGRHCDFDADCGVMCSAVASCAGPGDVFGETSRTDIIAFRNGAPCLGDGSGSFAAAGTLLALDPEPNANFGAAVDIIGSTAIVGAFNDDEVGTNSGAAYIYEFDGNAWVQAPKILPNPKDHDAFDRFGIATAIDEDNDVVTAVIGADLDDGLFGSSGSAYIFRKSAEQWVQQQRLFKPMKAVGDSFGFDVDISGQYVIVGAPRDNIKGNDSGAAFIYKDDGLGFTHLRTLGAGLFGDINDQYGAAVAISSDPEHGSVAVVGAWMDDETGANAGAAYVYRLIPGKKKNDPNVWQFEQKLCPAAVGDQFGWSVAVTGNQIAVGAWKDDELGINAGKVYVYTYDPDSGQWPTPEEVTDPSLVAGDNFGSSVDIEDDVLVVGAYLDDIVDTDAGVVHMFRNLAAGWTSVGRFVPADLVASDQLGFKVALSGDLVIGGAWMHEDTDMGQGSSYIFLVAPDPSDCDGSGLPDQCEIESGILPDCNGNGIPDGCDISDMTSLDDDLNGIPDECDQDCNGNMITDSTEIGNGTAFDCNENGIPDACDLNPADPDGDGIVSADIDMNGVPDECSPDCNANGIPDSTDISGGGSFDCNANGIPDECDRMDFLAESAQLGPVGPADQQTFTLNAATTSPQWALGDVSITVTANADLRLASEYVSLLLDGNLIFELFRSGALDCPVDSGSSPDVETRFIPADDWNRAIRRDNEAILLFDPSGSVDPSACPGGSWLQATVTYASGDCNNNNMLDSCEVIAGTVLDCNANGIPDECELALFDCNGNGVPDDCDFAPADIDGNGAVDIFDLLDLLAAWGPCPGCPEDITDAIGVGPDGAVDVFDLLEMLAAWTACP